MSGGGKASGRAAARAGAADTKPLGEAGGVEEMCVAGRPADKLPRKEIRAANSAKLAGEGVREAEGFGGGLGRAELPEERLGELGAGGGTIVGNTEGIGKGGGSAVQSEIRLARRQEPPCWLHARL